MRIIVIGAHGNVGRAAVEELSPRHEIIEIGRSSEPSVDLTDEASVERLFAATGTVDAVVCTVGSVPFKPWEELGRADHLAAGVGHATDHPLPCERRAVTDASLTVSRPNDRDRQAILHDIAVLGLWSHDQIVVPAATVAVVLGVDVE